MLSSIHGFALSPTVSTSVNFTMSTTSRPLHTGRNGAPCSHSVPCRGLTLILRTLESNGSFYSKTSSARVNRSRRPWSSPCPASQAIGRLLFVPLIISARGLRRLQRLFRNHPHCSIRPVLVIPDRLHVRPTPGANEPPFVGEARRTIERTAHVLASSRPFGFNDLGTLTVLYTNCPNHTPPLFWEESDRWHALFPRVSRRER